MPVGVAIDGDPCTQTLDLLVLYGVFQPLATVKIHHHTTLLIAEFGIKPGSKDKRKTPHPSPYAKDFLPQNSLLRTKTDYRLIQITKSSNIPVQI